MKMANKMSIKQKVAISNARYALECAKTNIDKKRLLTKIAYHQDLISFQKQSGRVVPRSSRKFFWNECKGI